MEFSNAALRYLVAVYELSDGGSAVRSVDIARMMEVSPASVVHMMGVLSQGGFVRKRRYGQVQLTREGIRTANRLYTKAALLEAFFLQELGPDRGRRHHTRRKAQEDTLHPRCGPLLEE